MDVIEGIIFSFASFCFVLFWYYYAGASNSWAVCKFISPQKNHLAHLMMAKSTSWNAFKTKILFYQQQLCLSFNLDQQIGSRGTVQEAIPGRLQSKISFGRTVIKGNYIISLSFLSYFPPLWFFFFFKEKTRVKAIFNQEESRRYIDSVSCPSDHSSLSFVSS